MVRQRGLTAGIATLVALTLCATALARGGPPAFEFGGEPVQSPKRVEITLLCPEDDCRVAVTGALGGGAKGRVVDVFRITAGNEASRRMILTRRQRRSVRRAVNQGKSPNLKLTATAVAQNGEEPGSTVAKLLISLR